MSGHYWTHFRAPKNVSPQCARITDMCSTFALSAQPSETPIILYSGGGGPLSMHTSRQKPQNMYESICALYILQTRALNALRVKKHTASAQ